MTAPVDRLTTALSRSDRVEKELGAGGMATVYLAHDLKHERDVAIKVLHPDLGAALGADRFLVEIKTTAKLQHPHILPLLASGALTGGEGPCSQTADSHRGARAARAGRVTPSSVEFHHDHRAFARSRTD